MRLGEALRDEVPGLGAPAAGSGLWFAHILPPYHGCLATCWVADNAIIRDVHKPVFGMGGCCSDCRGMSSGHSGLCDAVLVEGIEDPPRHLGGYKSGTICAEMT